MSYNNALYSYSDILNSSSYFYMYDDQLRFSSGVQTMQEKLNHAGFWCDIPDGIFGGKTDEAVRHFQRAYSLAVDGMAGRNTLSVLDYVSSNSPGFTKTAGNYGVYFDVYNRRFMYNQQTVYSALNAAGLNKKAIAGFMGNLEAEHQFRTALEGTGGAVGIAQWADERKTNLYNYANANSRDVTDIILQAWFIIAECSSGGNYENREAVNCWSKLLTASGVFQAADYVTALYERCLSCSSWSGVQNSGYATSRFSTQPNTYDGKYYLDTPKRRGYAEAYYNCIYQM